MNYKFTKIISSFFIILSVPLGLYVAVKTLRFLNTEIGLIWTIVYFIVVMNIYMKLNFSKITNRPIMNIIGEILFGGVYTIWYSIKYEFPVFVFGVLTLAIIFNGLGEYLNYFWMKRKGLDKFYGWKYPDI